MSGSQLYSGLYEFIDGMCYATVELSKSGDGWVSDWLVSRKLSNDLGDVQLLGHLRVPVYGDEKKDAEKRIGFIYEDIINMLVGVSGGTGSLGTYGDVKRARSHAKAHLQYWLDFGGWYTKTESTAVMYSLAVDFGVSSPAALIAEVEVIGVRSVHDRIAYARRINLLDSYGKGRIKGSNDNGNSEEPEQEISWEESGDDWKDDRDSRDIISRILRHGGDGDS